eukprot:2200071-Prymnesium_polylepis.1
MSLLAMLRRSPSVPLIGRSALSSLTPCAPLRRVCQLRGQQLRPRSATSAGFCSSASTPAKSSLVAWCEANPMKLGIGIATVKTQVADLLTQTALEGKAFKDIDWRRNVVFTIFGFGYFGCAQYYLYVNLFSRWFAGAARFVNQPLSAKLRDYAGQRAAAAQILFDLLIHPQWVFPMYYTLKQAVGDFDSFVRSPWSVTKTAVG